MVGLALTVLLAVDDGGSAGGEPPPAAAVLSDPTVLSARQALDRNEPAKALESLKALPPSGPVRYLRAMAAAKLGRTGAAAEELDLLSLNYPPLKDRSAYEAGLLYEQRGLPRKAIGLFERVDENAFVFPDARQAEARLLKGLGDLKRAHAALKPLVNWPLPRRARTQLLLQMADLAKARGDRKGEREALDLLAGVGAWWARQVGYRMGSPAVAMVAKADQLLDHGACRSAEKLARKLSGDRQAVGCSARVIAAEAAACTGKDVTADVQKIVKECKDADVAARALVTLGGMQAKAGKPHEAVKSLRAVASVSGPSLTSAEALFASFWVSWKADSKNASVVDLDAIEALPEGVLGAQDRARAAYWRARVLLERGENQKAIRHLGELASRHPATWYARLARQRLEELDAERAAAARLASVMPLTDSAPAVTSQELLPGLEALQLGLNGAADELVMLAKRKASWDNNRAAIEALIAAGEEHKAHRLARTLVREALGGDSHSAAVWRAAFPSAFSEAIGKHASAEQVPPPLLQGLVREESAFDPGARSHVGALGLSQLMPITARALAKERGKPLAALTELLESERNLELGAAYLGQMLRRFDGEAAIAAAAYNGGPTRVARWLKLRPCERLEEWVEEIPIDETRNYVKDVLASADVYRSWPALGPAAQGSAPDPGTGVAVGSP